MIAARSSALALGLLIVPVLPGCPSEEEPDEPIVLLDDDDSAAISDDDDDDSAVVPGPEILQAWVSDLEILGSGPDPLGRSQAEAIATTDLTPLGAWRLPDGTPVPGLGLHPDRGDLIEGCEAIDSVASDGLPAGFDVGAALVLAPSSGDSLALPLLDGRYVLEDGPRPASAMAWTLSAPEGELTASMTAPRRPVGVQPGPGTLSLLSPRNITWTPGGGDVEILLLRFASLVNETAWEAIRCVAEDDGAFIVDPTGLAGPNTGDLVLTLTRASWSADGATLFARSTAALATP